MGIFLCKELGFLIMKRMPQWRTIIVTIKGINARISVTGKKQFHKVLHVYLKSLCKGLDLCSDKHKLPWVEKRCLFFGNAIPYLVSAGSQQHL